MPDLGGITGPFRITTVVDSAHGGYFFIALSTIGASGTYSSANSSIFRSSTRFLWSPKNSTAVSLEEQTTSFRVNANNSGVVTITFSGSPSGAGRAEYYFMCFNGGTGYELD